MLTTHCGKNNLLGSNPILKSYLNKYSQLFSQYNFFKSNTENKFKKQLFIECITNDANFVYDNGDVSDYYDEEDDEDNDDDNNYSLNKNIYFILGSVFFSATSYSLYHFFYTKK